MPEGTVAEIVRVTCQERPADTSTPAGAGRRRGVRRRDGAAAGAVRQVDQLVERNGSTFALLLGLAVGLLVVGLSSREHPASDHPG